MMGKWFLVTILILTLVLIPSVVLAEDYEPSEEITLYVAVLDASGDPVTDATVTLDIRDSDGNLEVNDGAMAHVSDGVYEYDWTIPAGEDYYYVVYTAVTYGISYDTLHVVTPPAVAAVWDADLSAYTDVDTAGGILNTNLGGDIMFLIGLVLLAVGLMVAYFVKHHMIAGIVGGATLFVAGVQSYTMSSLTWDTHYGFAFFGMIAGVLIVVYALTMWYRERPVPEPVELDEVTGEPVGKDEQKTRRARRAKFSR